MKETLDWEEVSKYLLELSEDRIILHRYSQWGFHKLSISNIGVDKLSIEFYESHIYQLMLDGTIYESTLIPRKIVKQLNKKFYPILKKRLSVYIDSKSKGNTTNIVKFLRSIK